MSQARTESIAQVYEQIAFAIKKEQISCMCESLWVQMKLDRENKKVLQFTINESIKGRMILGNSTYTYN